VTKGMATIGRDGQIQISAFNRDMFRELEQMSGGAIKRVDLVKSARLSLLESLVQEKLMREGINNVTDDTITKLSSMASLDNGELQFNFGTEGIKDVGQVADEINRNGTDLLDKLNAVNEATNDPIKAMLQTNLSIGEKMTNMMNTFINSVASPELYDKLAASSGKIVGETNKVVEGVEGVSNSVMNFFAKMQKQGIEELENRYGGVFESFMDFDGKGVSTFIEVLSDFTDGIHNFDIASVSTLKGILKEGLNDPIKTLGNILFTFIGTIGSSILYILEKGFTSGANILIGVLNDSNWFGSIDLLPEVEFDAMDSMIEMIDGFIKKGNEMSLGETNAAIYAKKGGEWFDQFYHANDNNNIATDQSKGNINTIARKGDIEETLKYITEHPSVIQSTVLKNGQVNNNVMHNGEVIVTIKSDQSFLKMTDAEKRKLSKDISDNIITNIGTSNGNRSTTPETIEMQLR